jgi:hypothetical protein
VKKRDESRIMEAIDLVRASVARKETSLHIGFEIMNLWDDNPAFVWGRLPLGWRLKRGHEAGSWYVVPGDGRAELEIMP